MGGRGRQAILPALGLWIGVGDATTIVLPSYQSGGRGVTRHAAAARVDSDPPAPDCQRAEQSVDALKLARELVRSHKICIDVGGKVGQTAGDLIGITLLPSCGD
jgi:hypothetical protein